MNLLSRMPDRRRAWPLLLLAPLFLAAYFFTSPAEDAVILYDYARNLAQRGIVTYSQATVPIEGATDFLWMVIIGAFRGLGVDENLSALLLNLVAAACLVAGAGEARRKVAVFCGLVATPFLYASLEGFSAIFFSAIYVASVAMAVRNRPGTYVAVLLLCLVRPDGIVWGLGALVLKLAEHRRENAFAVEVRRAFAGLVLPGLAYFFVRAWYFGEWLPLPFLVKASGTRDLALFYADSVADVLLVLAPVVVAAVASDAGRVPRRLAVLFVAPVLFYSAMRLEQNLGNRFLAPMFFGAVFVLVREKSIRPLLVLLVSAAYLGQAVTRETLMRVVNSRTENILYLSRDLSSLDGRMLVTESGRLAYYSHWDVTDSWGLNTPRFAHHLISRTDLASLPPYDLVAAHCHLDLLDGPIEASDTGVRSWANQCSVLVSYMRGGDYEIFLVPYVRRNDDLPVEKLKHWARGHGPATPACQRYDIYAARRSYEKFDALRLILLKNLAIAYSSAVKTGGDDLVCRN